MLGTLTVLGIHMLLRPAGRLPDRPPAAGSDPDTQVPAGVHLRCERRSQTHTRALLAQALTDSGLTATGLRARREREDTTSVRAAVTVSGDAAAALEQVLSRLSLEPGVHDLLWHPPRPVPPRRGGQVACADWPACVPASARR